MATYRQIQDYVRTNNGFVAKTCWIAEVKSDCGLTHKPASNRIDQGRREYPCPENKRQAIETALRHFKMV